jgi:hypothetical protein
MLALLTLVFLFKNYSLGHFVSPGSEQKFGQEDVETTPSSASNDLRSFVASDIVWITGKTNQTMVAGFSSVTVCLSCHH